MDPLCQTQVVAYLKMLTADGKRFALITFEQPKYKLDKVQTDETRNKLYAAGILWYPLNYHKRFSLIATAFDCLSGILMGVGIIIRYRPRVVHSRSSISAAMAMVVAFIGRLKFLYDADSRLSEEYADTGHWARNGMAFRVTAWIEKLARNRSDSIVVLSERLRSQFIQEFKTRAPITVIPCCVAIDQFCYDPNARESRRGQLGLGNERLLIYVGKIGPRYLIREMLQFFNAAQEQIGPLRLLILTGEPPEAFQQVADNLGIGRDAYDIIWATRTEVAEWLSAADAGLAFIRSAGCEAGSSPVKIGEYLAVGLPVVVTDGIGDYSELIDREGLGVVVRRLDAICYSECSDILGDLWADQDNLRQRCREAAEKCVSLKSVGTDRYERVYAELLR